MSSDQVDVGRTAIGQALLLVTPLQMATVAQTIGNGGMRMEPRLVAKVVDPDGRTMDEPMPEQAERVMSDGQRRQACDDDEVRGPRGLRHRGGAGGRRGGGQDRHGGDQHRQGINDLWFIGFAGDVAVAVIIDREQGQGGTVAAPIAKQILQAWGSTMHDRARHASSTAATGR